MCAVRPVASLHLPTPSPQFCQTQTRQAQHHPVPLAPQGVQELWNPAPLGRLRWRRCCSDWGGDEVPLMDRAWRLQTAGHSRSLHLCSQAKSLQFFPRLLPALPLARKSAHCLPVSGPHYLFTSLCKLPVSAAHLHAVEQIKTIIWSEASSS